MRKYLISLNVILILFIFCSSFLFSSIDKVTYVGGGILGLISTGLVLIVDYMLCSGWTRSRKWIAGHFFSKLYPREAALNVTLAAAMYVLSLLLWGPVFIFFFGFMSTVVAFIMTEWVYKVMVFDRETEQSDGR